MSIHRRARAVITGAATAALLVSAAGCSLAGPGVATWQPAPGQQVADDATSFTAEVTRLDCNSGVTGEVNDPRVEESEETITITFTVSPSKAGAADCQGNDAVAYEVRLSAPLGRRTLVDGACASTEAGETTFCAPDGTRSFT